MQLPYSNTEIKHWNPGASMPLVLPVHVICNTSDEEIYQNIYENSRRPGKWLRLQKPHERIAVLCGSGPSLEDTLDEVRAWQEKGASIFAMNGAARYLYDKGILPDYQVIIDARSQTSGLVGPAREHLFASQVSPECFKKMPTAKVWHLQVERIDEYLPEYQDDYCLIGGAASVGNTATCLAFAMGYRDLQIYGYDSSHRDGKGHAFHQKMNEGDPCACVTFNGKEYIASLTMKLQAEKFQETAKALKDAGCHIDVHGSGLLPDIYNCPKLPEQDKYLQMWAHKDYREFSPGEWVAETFVQVAKVNSFSSVIDFGCGTGRGGKKIQDLTGAYVHLVDFARNSLDEGIDLPFSVADLSKPIYMEADYGFCTDVMEHIPPEQVIDVLKNILVCVDKAFFQISLVADQMGILIGQDLHLSVHSFEWWMDQFDVLDYKVEWSQNRGDTALFLVQSLTT